MSETRYVKIEKIDADQRLVFGWGNISAQADGTLIKDLQGHVIPEHELEQSTYGFVLKGGILGFRHQKDAGGKTIEVGKIVECVVFTPQKCAAMGIPPGIMPTGVWLGAYVHNDDVWSMVKSGELGMFSLGGKAKIVPLGDAP
jgi:hypothetical protein